MAEIIKVCRQQLPEMMFVGRRYGEADRENGTFGGKWQEWFESDLFAPLRLQSRPLIEHSDAPCGLCVCREGAPFEYWIGMFLPCDAAVPQGYESMRVEACEIGVCWVRGKEPDIYFASCHDALKDAGMSWLPDARGTRWCYERYVAPRFTVPDGNGDVILDQCYRIG